MHKQGFWLQISEQMVQTFSALQILSNFFLLDFEKDLWESVVVATKTPERSFLGAWVLVKSDLVDH